MVALRPLFLAFALLGLCRSAALAGEAPLSQSRRYLRTRVDPARRALVERSYDHKELEQRLGIQRDRYLSMRGNMIRRGPTDATALHESYRASLSRLTDLDPQKKLLGKAAWDHIVARNAFQGEHQVENEEERIAFGFHDPAHRLTETRRFEEQARGKLAQVLADRLAHESPSPERLKQIADSLKQEHPFLSNPFRVELLIADTQRLFPTLAKWDFRRGPGGGALPTARRLPKRLQDAVGQIGYRAFSHTNVLFANHMYKDSLVMMDTMMAAGLEPENARFVATPYPFDKRVQGGLERRGVATQHTAYSLEETKRSVEKALAELVQRAHSNNAPILVYDDGGIASSIIAEKYADQMFRFRVVEITKAGERVAKSTLSGKLGVDERAFGLVFNEKHKSKMLERMFNAFSWDGISRKQLEERWEQRRYRPPLSHDGRSDNTLGEKSFGFAHYTYSDSKYKREVMTPLYTHEVNEATLRVIEEGGYPLINKRVTVIGGGAMGQNAAKELREKGFEVTMVEPDTTRQRMLKAEGFTVEPLENALKGRGLIMELSGMKNILGVDHMFEIEDGAHVVHGSSKDNPFDMQAIGAIAAERVPWKDNARGQQSATYRFEAAGLKKDIHFPGDGFTISHGGAMQNVPLHKFLPEIEALVRLGVHALENQPVTHFPFFTAPPELAPK